MSFEMFVQVALIGLLAVISPGPDLMMVTRASLVSRWSGVYTAVGLALGILVHTALGVVGTQLLADHAPMMLRWLAVAGGLYLIWIGLKLLYGVYQNRGQQTAANVEAKYGAGIHPTMPANIANGFLTNVLNGKAAVFMMSLLLSVADQGGSSVGQMLVGMQMALIVFLWFATVAWTISSQLLSARLRQIQTKLDVVFGLLLVAFGGAVLWR